MFASIHQSPRWLPPLLAGQARRTRRITVQESPDCCAWQPKHRKREKAIFAQRIAAMSDFKPYLHSAHIEGYKSIVSCDVTFKPGLNIIIGKNGTGKTNLLEAVGLIVNEKAEDLGQYYGAAGRVDFQAFQSNFFVGLRIESKSLADETLERLENGPRRDQPTVTFEKKIGIANRTFDYSVAANRVGESVWGQLIHFRHTIQDSIPFLSDRQTGWQIGPKSVMVLSRRQDQNVFDTLQDKIRIKLQAQIQSQPNSIASYENVILNEMASFAKKLQLDLQFCSPISEIVPRAGNIDNGGIQGQYKATGFYFLFKVNESLQPFENLSDGTKRILLLVAETLNAAPSTIVGKPDLAEPYFSFNSNVLAIEEPELGIHPHQLHLLLNFLKEQSKEKQIIITTHAPQVLDILTKDELDRITIADFDPEKGSTFRHLNEKELTKAKFIMEEEPLSFYWRYSDLEHTPMF
jgi:predicted ATPase